MNKKITFVLVLALAAFLVMGSASAGFFDFLGGDSGDTVKIGYLPSDHDAALFVADAQGLYKEKGININAVSPTMVETSFLENIDERLVEMTAANSGMKRNVKIEEVVGAIKYLMADESAYVNGVNLPLTGGDII